MMRWICIAMVAVSGRAALADDATQFFDSLYGNRIKQVKASLDRADDLALARDILTAAKTLERIDVLAVMCDQIVELSQRSAEGAPIAIEAWDLLAQKVEPRRAEARKLHLAQLKVFGWDE